MLVEHFWLWAMFSTVVFDRALVPWESTVYIELLHAAAMVRHINSIPNCIPIIILDAIVVLVYLEFPYLRRQFLTHSTHG